MAGWPPLESLVLRLLIVGSGVAAWFVTQRWIGKRRLDDGEISDRLHQLTAAGNTWLHAHPRVADACLIVSSLAIDALSLFVLGYALVGRSFAPFWGLLTLFVLRQAGQATVALPPPPGIIWRHPGFPSLGHRG